MPHTQTLVPSILPAAAFLVPLFGGILVLAVERLGHKACQGVTRALFEAGCNLGETSMLRLGNNFTIMMMVKSEAGPDGLQAVLQPVVDTLELILHIDAIQAKLHQRPVPDVRILVHGADRAGIVAEVTGQAAAAGLNILDLESDVGGTEAQPIYILQIDNFIVYFIFYQVSFEIGKLECILIQIQRNI